MPKMTTPLTCEQHLDTLCEMTRLQLWFVHHWLRHQPGESFTAALRRRVDIFRMTDLYDGRPLDQVDHDTPAWLELERQLHELHEQARRRDDPQGFEHRGLAVLRDRLAARARRDERAGFPTVPASSQCHSLRFDPPRPPHTRRVGLHIGNALRPRSIFDDALRLAAAQGDAIHQRVVLEQLRKRPAEGAKADQSNDYALGRLLGAEHH